MSGRGYVSVCVLVERGVLHVNSFDWDVRGPTEVGFEDCKLTQTRTADTTGCCGTTENPKQIAHSKGGSVHCCCGCCFYSTKTIILYFASYIDNA